MHHLLTHPFRRPLLFALLLGLCWCCGLAGAAGAAQRVLAPSEAQALFRRANENYQKQNFPEARSLYLQLAESGITSAEVYYNLANASARLGRVGEAVLYYEKARLLDPRNPDISANLQRVAPPGNDPAPFVLTLPFHWLLHRLGLREWMGLFLLVYLTAGLLGATLLSRLLPGSVTRGLRPLLVIAAVATILCGIFAAVAYYQVKGVTRTVVMRPEAIVRSGPGENFSQLIAVPEGAKLRRLEFADDPRWARVALPTGETGYTLSSSLRVI